ncbi:hemerythrin domain-containing protein [Tessaracoccus sp. MC1679]|uniref:hemerythrin domain-containing protein n=1 Tax=unclassified Tessaracoccus TaxID=2635419 RepID=UPI0016042827|nr:hemerythrin domain-containing protein [Tessaracoccus sp. MC1627]MBB1514490.1 hemerythrin domain-containing protein [Tessaracoccus sp. MC1679]
MCSYCGCDSITVIGRFMNEHVEIVNACGQLRRAVVDGGDVPEHARALALLLGPHTQSEEVGLFTVMKRRDEFADHVSILCGEHRSLDELLAAIAAGDHSLMDVFEDALRDHIDKEDNGLFPAAALGLDGDEWAEIDTTTHEHDHAAGTPHHH